VYYENFKNYLSMALLKNTKDRLGICITTNAKTVKPEITMTVHLQASKILRTPKFL
jgi:hypothetical protein